MTLRRWSIGGQFVECPLAVINKISAAARDGFTRFPHGGVEVGGILTGERQGETLRISSAVPIQIEYALGASFVLTEADQSAFHRMLQGAPDTVGWYVSHTRSDTALGNRDLAIRERFDRDPAHVCLVVRPAADGAERWALYVFDADGSYSHADTFVDTVADDEWSPRIATIPAVAIEQPRATAQAGPAMPYVEAAGDVAADREKPHLAAPVVSDSGMQQSEHKPLFLAASPRSRPRWVIPAAAATMIACASAGWYALSPSQRPPAAAVDSVERNRTVPPAAAATEDAEPSAATPDELAATKPPTKKQLTGGKHNHRAHGRHRRGRRRH